MTPAFSAVLSRSVTLFFNLIEVMIFVRVLLSWVPGNFRSNPILAIVYAISDPILDPIRKMIDESPLGGRGMMLDFSPFFALFLLTIAQSVILNLISII